MRTFSLVTPLVLLVGLVPSCANSGWLQKDLIHESLSPEGILLDVEPVRQETRNACGLACMAALLRYHGVEEIEVVSSDSYPLSMANSVDGQDGVAAAVLKEHLKARGLRAAIVRGSLDEQYPAGIFSVLRRGLPVIVQLDIPKSTGGASRHYVLVVGFEPRSSWMFVMDPVRGTGAVPYTLFDEYWTSANRLMLIAARSEGT